MNALFLTTAEIRDLTGLTQPRAQIRWLQKNGVHHYVRADGHPRVPVTALDASQQRTAIAGAAPDFDAVRVGH